MLGICENANILFGRHLDCRRRSHSVPLLVKVANSKSLRVGKKKEREKKKKKKSVAVKTIDKKNEEGQRSGGLLYSSRIN